MPLGAFRLNSLARYVAAGGGRTAKTITAYGNAQIDTAQYKFGTSSVYFDGAGDYLSVTDDPDFDFSSGNFTIECWVRLDGTNPDYDHIIGTWSNTNSLRQNFIGLDGGNKPVVYYMDGSSIRTDIIGPTSLTTGQWYHLAWVGDTSDMRFYVNGTQVDNAGTRYYSQDANNNFTLGADQGGSNPFIGWVDEARVSRSVRYTGSSFSVPTSPFTNDEDTVLLLHMEGSDGSTTFTDDNS